MKADVDIKTCDYTLPMGINVRMHNKKLKQLKNIIKYI